MAANGEPQEIHAFLVEVGTAGLVLVEDQTLGASHTASRALTCSVSCLEWQKARRRVGVADHDR